MILCRYCHCLRLDRQRAGFRCDDVVIRHVYIAVHDLVAFCDRIIAIGRIVYVRHAACGFRNEAVSREKLARSNRYRSVLVRISVICPLLACRRDGDLPRCVHHRQLAVLRGYSIVVCASARELVGLKYICLRAFGRECDAAGDDRADGIVPTQSRRFEFVAALCCSVVCKLLALCFYR